MPRIKNNKLPAVVDVMSKKKKKFGEHKSPNPFKASLSRKQVSCNWAMFIKTQDPNRAPFKIPDNVGMKPPKRKPRKKGADKVVALDCEMVSNDLDENMLARVSIVNYKLVCIYDKYVKPTSPVGDYRTRYSGIRESDLVNGEDFEVVQKEVRELLFNKILVGHALNNDFGVLKFRHHMKLIRDTATYGPFKEACSTRSPSLKNLCKKFLEEDIQKGEHDSVEDARAAMKLYVKFRQEWEKSLLPAAAKAKAVTAS